MTKRIFLGLAVCVLAMFLARPALARDGRESYEYIYSGGHTVLWERNGQCRSDMFRCFVLFADWKEDQFVARISRPVDAPFALTMKLLNSSEEEWVIHDLRTRKPLLKTANKDDALTGFQRLTGSKAWMLEAGNGPPSRPMLWRTPLSLRDIATREAPALTLTWAGWLSPFYLLAIAAWIAAIRLAFRHHDAATRFVTGVGSLVAAPLVPFVCWSSILLGLA